MRALFLSLAANSLRGGALILAVLLLRLCLRRTPRRVLGPLWGLAGLRLLAPLRLTAFFGLLPGRAGDEPETQVGRAAASVAGAAAETPALDWPGLLPWLWLTVAAGLLLWAAGRAIALRRRLADALPTEDGAWVSERIPSPFAFGLCRPRVYLPAGLGADCLPWVLAHEKAHLRHGDTRRKALAFVLLAVYWFHPLCWLGWFAYCRDLELACDERVTVGLPLADRKRYALALLQCSAPVGALGAAFGEKPVRGRIRALLRDRRQPRWVSALVGAACGLLLFCLCFEAPAAARSPAPTEPTAALAAESPSVEHSVPPAESSEPGNEAGSLQEILLAGGLTNPALQEAIQKTLAENDAVLYELSGPLSVDGNTMQYYAVVVSNDGADRFAFYQDRSDDGQTEALTLRLRSARSGELRIELSAEEAERPFSCSSLYADDEGKAVYWTIQTTP